MSGGYWNRGVISLFVNYFKKPTRESRLNLVVARFLVGGYVIWKMMGYNWNLVVQTPFTLAFEPYTALLPPAAPLVLPVEKWILMLLMVSFIFGYRLRLSTFLGALLLGHLGAILATLNPSGVTTSLFIAVWFLVFFGLFHQQSSLTLESPGDQLDSLSTTNRYLKSKVGPFEMDPLRWSLLSIAVVYFGAGLHKVVQGPFWEWATVENLSRTIVMRNALEDIFGGIGPNLVQYPSIILLAAIGTLVIELGFVVAVLGRLPITPFVLGIFVFQLGVGLTMGIFFFDIYPFLLLFFAWDSFVSATESENQLDVVYDDHSLFCARTLTLFKVLDVRDSLTMYGQRDMPERYRESVNVESAVYVFSDGEVYRGYFAFRELLNHFGIVSWIGRVMSLSPVAIAGERLYEFISRRTRRDFD